MMARRCVESSAPNSRRAGPVCSAELAMATPLKLRTLAKEESSSMF